MRKSLSFFIALLFLLNFSLDADEGMWLLPLLKQLNFGTMQEIGLELGAEDIYSINNSSIKDAIVIFDDLCTGEMISSQGLLLTNHHCGYGAIQSHSTVENDYLTDGYWASSRETEIPSPGMSVTFLIRIEDVSEEINSILNPGMTEEERKSAVGIASEELEAKATENTNYFAEVQSFFGGNQYFMLVYERYTDVRLVGAPPSSIGLFGGDTDNWMWPRHTGDFALFRVYTGPDGAPADYSEDNIPMKPRHHLPVSTRGIEADDFAMVMGYPAFTSRYITSFGVDEVLKNNHPESIIISGIGLHQEILLADMLESDKVRIQYADKYSNSTNFWKYSIGQNESLIKLGIYDEKKALEMEFSSWVEADYERKTVYGEALGLIDQAIKNSWESEYAANGIAISINWICDIVAFANRSNDLMEILTDKNADNDSVRNAIENVRGLADIFYKDYNPPTDQKVVAALLSLLYNDIDKIYHPDYLTKIHKKYKGDFEKFSADLFKKSIFSSQEKFESFLVKPNAKTLAKDPGFLLARSSYEKLSELRENVETWQYDRARGHRLFIAGLMEMQDDKVFYPDANFSMRLTYGTVGGYHPRDAVYYEYISYIEGLMEKEDTDNREFVVPEKLKELYKKKDYGTYGVNGTLPVNFITNNDIAGGNSGSPVINSRGELIGLVFDGNWEAMSGDITFEPSLQRCIAVDVRYILFIIDKFAGASHLIEEMTLIN